MRSVRELDGRFGGLPLWCIGRGPSLANLRKEHIGDGPVVAINQAIEKVEAIEGLQVSNPIFSMQKDRFFLRPKYAALLLHAHESAVGFALAGIEYLYAFDAPADFNMPRSVPSVVCAAGLAARWGCERVVYLCCDAATDNVTEAYGAPATKPADYLAHKRMVLRHATIPVEWRRIEEVK